MSRLKITGFGKFIIFLAIVGPIAYFGAQYLQNSGALDKMKEKVEDIQASPPEAQPESSEDILSQIDDERNQDKSKTQAERDAEAIIAEQQRKIDELKRQNEALRTNDPVQPSTVNIPPPPPPVNTPSSSGLDDLIATAEDNMRQKGNSPSVGGEAPSSNGTSTSLATWAFSFSGVSGTIELFQQGQKLVGKTSYAGSSRVDVQEFIKQNDRLYVKGSPTQEYYVLKSNGDLDAYDESGFLTTCRRR